VILSDSDLEKVELWQLRILIAAAALLALVPAWLHYGIISNDGVIQYIPPAKLFVEGRFSEGLLRPHQLFSLLIALAVKLFGVDYELGGRLVAATGYILSVLALFEITLKLTLNRLTSCLAAFLLMLNPEFATRSVDCLKESALIAFVLWGNYLLLWPLNKALLSRLIGLVLLGCGFLLRPTAVYFMFGWLAVCGWHLADKKFQRYLYVVIPPVLLALIVYFNRDSALLNSKGVAFATLLACLKKFGLNNVIFILKVVAVFVATGGYMAFIAGLCGVGKVANRDWKIILSVVMGLALIVHVMMGWLSNRYVLLPLAWFYSAVAVGLIAWLRSSKIGLRVLAILTLISVVGMWGHAAFKDPDQNRLDQRSAGLWIKHEFGGNARVYSNRPRLVFYADGVPDDHPGRLVAIDTCVTEDVGLDKSMRATGLKPLRSFGSINVYFRPILDSNRSVPAHE